MGMMSKMMEGMDSGNMMETMHEMMEDCLTPMSEEEERRNMLTFCRKMLGEMEEKFLTSTPKGEANS